MRSDNLIIFTHYIKIIIIRYGIIEAPVCLTSYGLKFNCDLIYQMFACLYLIFNYLFQLIVIVSLLFISGHFILMALSISLCLQRFRPLRHLFRSCSDLRLTSLILSSLSKLMHCSYYCRMIFLSFQPFTVLPLILLFWS